MKAWAHAARAWWLAAAIALGCSRAGDAAPEPSVGASPQPTPPPASASAIAVASSAPRRAPAPAPPPPLVSLEGDAIRVIDLHVDTAWKVHFKGRPITLPEGHATPDMLRRGGYAAVVYPIYIPDYLHQGHPRITDAEGILATLHKLFEAHDLLVPVGPEPVPPDRVAAFLAIEGAGAFAEDVAAIDRFIDRGVRLVGPVHARDNKLAGSATGARRGGLTELGKELCRRVYVRGALIDVSHMSDAAFADLAALAQELGRPIVATHSNARALADHPRNLTDEQLRIIGESGGVAGLNLHRAFVGSGSPRMADVVAMVQHMIDKAGVDHVGIGSDFDGGNPVDALADAGRMQELARALLQAGLAEADVRKVMGANALRVLTAGPPR